MLEKWIAAGNAAWFSGELRRALALYDQVLAVRATSWRASLQRAWIEGAFATLPAERLDLLDRPSLPSAARHAVAALRRRAARVEAGELLPLEGGLGSWDIGSMRLLFTGGGSGWWEMRATRATMALQHGLAHACYSEAEQYSTRYDYDPPRQASASFLSASQHLTVVRGRDQLLAHLRLVWWIGEHGDRRYEHDAATESSITERLERLLSGAPPECPGDSASHRELVESVLD